jgi:sugar lactone lactonase YvrE
VTVGSPRRRSEPRQARTVAGIGWRLTGDAATTAIGWPLGIVRHRNGDLIVADFHGHRLWRVDMNGQLHVFAGDGVPGFAGDGGAAADSRLNQPHDLCRDRAGNIYVCDWGNLRVRRIDVETTTIVTVAGSGEFGREGDGARATDAQFESPCGVACDSQGLLYIADELACSVRRVDSSGIISMYAGTGTAGFSGDGGSALEASLNNAEHLSVDADDNLYICDNGNDRIRKVTPEGIIWTIAGRDLFGPDPPGPDSGISRHEETNLPITIDIGHEYHFSSVKSSAGDHGPATLASLNTPDSLFADREGNVFIGEMNGFRIRRIDATTGVIDTVIGTGVPNAGQDGRPAETSEISSPESGLWVDADGAVLWSDCSGRVRRADPETRLVRTLLGEGHPSPEGSAVSTALVGPLGLDVSPGGDIFVADCVGRRVRRIDGVNGTASLVAGNGARATAGDGGPATDACLGSPHDVAVDLDGNVYIADARYARIRRVDPSGIITTWAGTGTHWDSGDEGHAGASGIPLPMSILIDAEGRLLVGQATGQIRRISPATGHVATIAGTGLPGFAGDEGPATRARLSQPADLAVGQDGSVLFADVGCHRVRRIDPTGRIETIVGTGRRGFSPDGSLAREASISGPRGVAVDPEGVVFFTDTGNQLVRTILADGSIETLAGQVRPGDGPDGPALEYHFNHPCNLAIRGGTLLVSDHFNMRIIAVDLG